MINELVMDSILRTQMMNDKIKDLENERTKQINVYNARKLEHPTLFCRKTVGIISGLSCKITNIKRKHQAQLKILDSVEDNTDTKTEIRRKLGLRE
jgi:hypothetical protein